MIPYYEDAAAGIVIYHGDCRDVLPTLAPESVDLVLTDPPYAEETHLGARTGEAGDKALVDFACTSAEALKEIYAQAATVSKAWLVATMDWRHIRDMEKVPPVGWRFVRFGVWIKPNGAPQFTGDRPATGWEGVCILHRERPSAWNGGGHHAVWTCPKENSPHPTGKPLPLISRWVELFSNPGDLLCDPFMGWGTTLRAAKNLGRRAIGIELDERYCALAADRLRQEVMTFETAPAVVWEQSALEPQP